MVMIGKGNYNIGEALQASKDRMASSKTIEKEKEFYTGANQKEIARLMLKLNANEFNVNEFTYESLEFLGDAVLDLLVNDYLYDAYPNDVFFFIKINILIGSRYVKFKKIQFSL